MKNLLVAVVLLAVSSGALGLVKQQFGIPLHSSATPLQDSCDTCKSVIQDAEDYISDPKTQDIVVTFLLENVCPILPGDSARTCTQEARVVVAQAVASMEQDMPPNTICTYMGACAKDGSAPLKSVTAPRPVIGPVQCPLCKMLFTSVVQRLQDPEARAKIHDAAVDACNAMEDPAAAAKCLKDVEQLFVDIDALLDDVNPGTACEVLQFCDHAEGLTASDVSVETREALLRVKDVVEQLRAMPIAAVQQQATSNDDDNCDACMNVITEVAAVLANPDTQEEVFDYAKQGCEAFDSYEEQCKDFVDEYGPLVMGLALSYLQPKPFCTQMGYCDAPMMAGGAVAV